MSKNKGNKELKVNIGIVEVFSEDMLSLLERVALNGVVLDSQVYIRESEIKESLSNFLAVYNITDNDLIEEYYKKFKEIKDSRIIEQELDSEIIYRAKI